MPTPSLISRFQNGYARSRQRLEHGFERGGYFIHDHAGKVILLFALMAGYLASHIPNIEVDTSTEGFLQKDDPFRIGYNAFRFQFGRDERVILVIDSGST